MTLVDASPVVARTRALVDHFGFHAVTTAAEVPASTVRSVLRGPARVKDTTAAALLAATPHRRCDRRFPTDPIDRWLRSTGTVSTERHPEGSHLAVAEQLGIDHAQWHRWRREGLTLFTADRLACQLGVHPLLLWPDFHADLEENP